MDYTTIIVSAITSIVVALLTALVTYKGIWTKSKADLENEYRKRFNEKRWAIYVKFTDWVRLAVETYIDPNVTPQRLLRNLEKDLVIIASELVISSSDNVIKRFKHWRVLLNINGLWDQTTTHGMIELILEMRKDLGESTTSIGVDDILGSLVPNYQRILP